MYAWMKLQIVVSSRNHRAQAKYISNGWKFWLCLIENVV